MSTIALRRGAAGVVGFLISGSLTLWLPLMSFGMLFSFSEDSKPDSLQTGIALAPAGACLAILFVSFWFGLRKWQIPFARGLFFGAAFALAVAAMFFLAARIAA